MTTYNELATNTICPTQPHRKFWQANLTSEGTHSRPGGMLLKTRLVALEGRQWRCLRDEQKTNHPLRMIPLIWRQLWASWCDVEQAWMPSLFRIPGLFSNRTRSRVECRVICSHVTPQSFTFLRRHPGCPLAIVFVFPYYHPFLWLKKMPPQDWGEQ